jgi:hypothetical protein
MAEVDERVPLVACLVTFVAVWAGYRAIGLYQYDTDIFPIILLAIAVPLMHLSVLATERLFARWSG